MQRIRITAAEVTIQAELNDTATGKAIAEKLPLEGSANTWGDEIYFEIPVSSQLDDSAKEVVEKGDIGYWPSGSAICFFWGPTPASQGDEIRPASAVNIVGKIEGDATVLGSVPSGSKVLIEKAG